MSLSRTPSFNGSSCVIGDLTWVLPGMGQSNSDCGVLLDSGKKNDCGRVLCSHPHCYSRVLKKKAYNIYSHISDSGLEISNLRHIVFSPPQGWVIDRMTTEGGFKYLRCKARKIIKEAGVEGAVLFFHPLRLTDFVEEFYGELGLELKDIWKKIAEGGIPFSEDTVKIGPHFHTLATGYLTPSDVFQEETDWSYRNLGSLEYSLRNRIKYNLNHVGLILGEDGDSRINSYSYVGKLAQRGGK